MSIEIRPVTPDDADGIRALLTASYRTLLREHYGPEELAAFLPRVVEPGAALLRSGTYYVAIEEQVFVGCGGWGPAVNAKGERVAGVGRIRRLATHPNHLRRGIATRLMGETERSARKAGIVRLECNAAFGAEAFYRRLGYVPAGDANITIIPKGGLPSVRMAKLLG